MLPWRKYTKVHLSTLSSQFYPSSNPRDVGKACHHTILISTTAGRANLPSVGSQHMNSTPDPNLVHSTCWSQFFTHLHFTMVKLAVATSLTFCQLALLSRTSLALPVHDFTRFTNPDIILWVS